MDGQNKLVGTFFMARAAMNRAIGRLDAMPLILRILCAASLFTGIGILVISIFQIGSIRILGEKLSWGQVRAAGYYPFLIISGVAMTAAGIGIWMRRGWSRWLVVLLYLFQCPIEIIYWRGHSHGEPWSYSISAVLWAAFFYWYLFFKQKNAFD